MGWIVGKRNLSDYIKLSLKVILEDPQHTARHIADSFRYYRPWRNSFTNGADPLFHKLPWIPFTCQQFLRQIIGPSSIVFEFGSGGSTMFFSGIAGKLFSVEHDDAWFETVSVALEREGVTNVEYFLKRPSPHSDKKVSGPCLFGYSGSGYPGASFHDYARVIDPFDDNSLDLVMVDGRARNACVWHSLGKVKPGGYLVLDNAERDSYLPARTLMEGWVQWQFVGVLPYGGGFCKTLVWEKPSER